jgi:hypothetical protein
MSRNSQRLTVESGTRRGLFTPGQSVELVGVALKQPDHFTRLLPSGDTGLPLLMLPLRLAALGVLWATSTPRRSLVAALFLAALVIAAH